MITILSITTGILLVVCVVMSHTAKRARKHNHELLGECAALEHRLDDMTEKYNNEVDHRKWATSKLKERTEELKAYRYGKGTAKH